MSTSSQSRNAQFMLKKAGLFAGTAIATVVCLMNLPVQAQTKKFELDNKAEITVVKNNSGTVPNGYSVELSATCPNNTIAISGGGQVSPGGVANAYLTATSPVLSSSNKPTGWHIIGTNVSGNNLTFSVYAICAEAK